MFHEVVFARLTFDGNIGRSSRISFLRETRGRRLIDFKWNLR